MVCSFFPIVFSLAGYCCLVFLKELRESINNGLDKIAGKTMSLANSVNAWLAF